MTYENITTATADAVLTITINRPTKLNALSAATLRELRLAAEAAATDPAVGAVIVTGAETGKKPSFAAGADIAEMATMGAHELRAHARLGQAAAAAFESCPKPVIAAVNGFALGGGCELAMACHIRFASKDALFGQPEVNLGLITGFGGSQRLPRLVGRGRALEILLSGDMLNAEEACRIGLVNRVYGPAELMPACVELAKKMASKAPVARALTIDAVVRGGEMPLNEANALEADLFGLAGATEDVKEGLKAHLERRAPAWKGK